MTSRYGPDDLLPPSDGLPLRVGRVAQLEGTYTTSHYTVRGDSQRMDTLAEEFLGDATMWWVLADMNPDLQVLEELPPQTRLRVPYGPDTPS